MITNCGIITFSFSPKFAQVNLLNCTVDCIDRMYQLSVACVFKTLIFAPQKISTMLMLLWVIKFSFFVSSVVLAAGVLQWVEWRATPKHVQESESCLSYGCLSFYDAFYFVIVTVNDLHFSPCSHQSEYLTLPPKSAYILDPANK